MNDRQMEELIERMNHELERFVSSTKAMKFKMPLYVNIPEKHLEAITDEFQNPVLWPGTLEAEYYDLIEKIYHDKSILTPAGKSKYGISFPEDVDFVYVEVYPDIVHEIFFTAQEEHNYEWIKYILDNDLIEDVYLAYYILHRYFVVKHAREIEEEALKSFEDNEQ